MKNNRVIELFLEFRREVMAQPEEKLARFADKEFGQIDWSAMAFMTIVDAHALALTNEVNEFVLYLSELRAWKQVLSTLEEHERFEAMELVHPLVHLCMGSPYTLKVRFCRSIAQVSHQGNRFVVDGWRDDEDVQNPNFKTARRLAGQWPSWPRLEGALSKLNSDEFKATVYDFRNESQHGFPRQIEIGVTPFVRRERTESGVGYSFGAYPPLALADAVAALTGQCAAALAVHAAYTHLVDEQRREVVAKCASAGGTTL